jgi:hypothetical protein
MRVTSAEDWAVVNERLADFADGIVREVGIRGGEHIERTGVLVSAGYPRVVAYVQMQGAGGTSAKLEFCGVRRLAFDHAMDVSPAIVTDVERDVWEVQLLGLKVAAEECVVTITGADGLGRGPFALSS